MAITDLTGYTWVGNSSLTITNTTELSYNISGSYEFPNGGSSGTFATLSYISAEIEPGRYMRIMNVNGSMLYAGSWNGPAPVVIEFADGTDATNSTLISWLEANGTLTAPIQAPDYTFTHTLTNCTPGNITLNLSADSGYELPAQADITVTGGSIVSYNQSTGALVVTGDTTAVEVTCEEATPAIGTLEETDWSVIKQVSDAGTASQYWNVGDSKTITLNGTIGTLTVNNLQLKAYILGFDHNIAVESGGSYSHSITFGFALDTNNVNVALCDSHYGSNSTDGSKWFNMNHSANTNSGGWKGCDMRYDILGSVEVKNQQDATSAATSSPVENTLMAALPSALRAVMKPITKYTDNVGGGTDTAANVTATVDYLPLLAEKEIFGSRSYANSTEQSHQAQYAFYANGNSKVKYNHSSTSSAVHWWERSAYCTNSTRFCVVNNGGDANFGSAKNSYGVAPIFAV